MSIEEIVEGECVYYDGTSIEIPPRNSVWEWRAEYEDGTWIDEYEYVMVPFEEKGDPLHIPYELSIVRFHGTKDIDFPRVRRIILIPKFPNLSFHVLLVTPPSQFILFRRYSIICSDVVNEKGEIQEVAPRIGRTVIGFHQNVKGVNVASYTAFFDDGSSVVTDNKDLF